MTKQESILKAIKIWQYLADNPTQTKNQAYKSLSLEKDHLYCPFCEYVIERDNLTDDTPITCKTCPAYGHWGDDKQEYCTDDNSYYELYKQAILKKDTGKKAVHSQQIVDMCKNLKQSSLKTETHAIQESINNLVKETHDAAVVAGWWDREITWETVPRCLMLIVSEIAEGMEGHRKNLMDDKLPNRKMLEVELADAMLRICDLSGALDFDLGGAVVEKMDYNAKRLDHKIENRQKVNGKNY